MSGMPEGVLGQRTRRALIAAVGLALLAVILTVVPRQADRAAAQAGQVGPDPTACYLSLIHI